jgi:hypothetical protein
MAGSGILETFYAFAKTINHDHRDRRGLFSIHKKYGLLNRHPKKVSFFNFD